MGSTTIYYIPEAINHRFAFDGIYAYEAIGSLKGLDGRRKIGRLFKRIGKGLKKIGRKVYKVAKKVIPIASTVASFIPGAGWAVKAGLSLAETAIDINENRKAKKNGRSIQIPQPQVKKESRGVVAPQPISNRLPVVQQPARFTNYVNQQANYKKNDIKALIDAIYRKNHVSPETILTLARAQQPDPDNLSQLIAAKSTNNVQASTIETETKAQLRASKHNIFSEVLENLFT